MSYLSKSFIVVKFFKDGIRFLMMIDYRGELFMGELFMGELFMGELFMGELFMGELFMGVIYG